MIAVTGEVTWIRNPDSIKFVGTKIDNYFEYNTDQTSASMWSTSEEKWSVIQPLQANEKNLKIWSFGKQIKLLEIDLKESDDPTKQRDLLLLRTKYNKLLAEKTAKSLMWLKQQYYEESEKAGKLLAWRVKKYNLKERARAWWPANRIL